MVRNYFKMVKFQNVSKSTLGICQHLVSYLQKDNLYISYIALITIMHAYYYSYYNGFIFHFVPQEIRDVLFYKCALECVLVAAN
jgi:hypothetical protein